MRQMCQITNLNPSKRLVLLKKVEEEAPAQK